MPVPSAIDHRARGYSLGLAYWLAQASDLAYKDEATIEKQARQWGFEKVRHHHTRFGQSLFFTGHSLGGALAMLAGARLYLEDPKLLAGGVYTYGQSRTCDRLLAEAYNKGFKQRMFRFVNNNDVVPTLPPEPAYTHVDTLRYLGSDGRLREKTSLFGNLADHARGYTADALAPAGDGVRDHSIHQHIAALEKNLA
ncbi:MULTISPECIES: lipase family protein [Streptomyces]|uniref:Fungal lipase-type domain-containing protein n=1 Tax=Streptomyces griseocarneus TaxID=51201 RepID=A0ABX7RNI1_9ACTN|nr:MULTISPECIES: hypothetical protein [Streptomyces]QSY49835.1 hypothetical protein J3S04_01620 [Streptomyces griseocarneus]